MKRAVIEQANHTRTFVPAPWWASFRQQSRSRHFSLIMKESKKKKKKKRRGGGD
jgi:hypothetical protein